MHETWLVNRVVQEIKKNDIKEAKILLGRMNCSSYVFRELFRAFVTGTPLENVKLEVEEVPVEINCSCGYSGSAGTIEHDRFVRCPKCGEIADVVRGDDLEIVY